MQVILSAHRPNPLALTSSSSLSRRKPRAKAASEPAVEARKGIEDVYYVKFPFVGLERVEDVINFYGLQLPEALTQHCAILIHRPQEARCVVYDFLPQDPTSPQTAVQLLSGGSTKGILRHSPLRRVPQRRSTYLGLAKVSDAMQAAIEFNASWDPDLKLNSNDCRDHCKALARLLLDNPTLELE